MAQVMSSSGSTTCWTGLWRRGEGHSRLNVEAFNSGIISTLTTLSAFSDRCAASCYTAAAGLWNTPRSYFQHLQAGVLSVLHTHAQD